MTSFWALYKRELSLLFKHGGGIGIGITFFLSLIIIFPFGIGPDLKTLQIVGSAVLWAGPLFSILLGIERSFIPDFDDGSFDIYQMSGLSLSAISGVKILANWTGCALPLIVCCPFFGMMLGMDMGAILGCVISLLIGSPAISCFGIFCGALTARIKRAGMLTAILAIPFLVPTLIFGISTAVAFNTAHLPFLVPCAILLALSLLAGLISVIGCAVILKPSH